MNRRPTSVCSDTPGLKWPSRGERTGLLIRNRTPEGRMLGAIDEGEIGMALGGSCLDDHPLHAYSLCRTAFSPPTTGQADR